MADHDTDDAGQHLALRPSPLAPRDGGAAFTSVSQRPADAWPRPFSQPSSFVYGARFQTFAFDRPTSFESKSLEQQMRGEGFLRRLIFVHGASRAADIDSDQDPETAGDLAKWQAFGG